MQDSSEARTTSAAAPPPLPPYSTSTAKAILGSSAGAKPIIQEWSIIVFSVPAVPRYHGTTGLGLSRVEGSNSWYITLLFSSRSGFRVIGSRLAYLKGAACAV